MKKNSKKVLGVIPARLGSTRIPNKMLADICGKTLIARTIERSLKAESLDALVVATDSEDIAKIAESLGVKAYMTDSDLPTGTDRVAAALADFTDFEPDIVVNIWGDEPLYPASAIDGCVAELLNDDSLPVALAGDKITDQNMLDESSIVQVLTDLKNNVLFFTRAHAPYPYTNSLYSHYHVIGVMAMQKSFITQFLDLPRTPIEMVEGVEQMRILEHGFRMRLVKGEFNNLGVNTPEELEVVRSIISKQMKG